MEIYLDEKYRIVTVPLNFVLEKWEDSRLFRGEKTKEGWKVQGHYSRIEHLLWGYMRGNMFTSEAKNIEELISEVQRIEKKIDNIKWEDKNANKM